MASNLCPTWKEGCITKAAIERERWIDRVWRALKPLCNCVSVAARQAREAEIEVPSKRRFRQILESGEASFAIPQDAGPGMDEVVSRTGIGVRAFLDCLDDVKDRSENSLTDLAERRSYWKVPE